MSAPLALLAVTALVAATLVIGWLLRRRDGRPRPAALPDRQPFPVHPGDRGAHATLVQFSTDMCARCPQVRRMLTEIAQEREGVGFAEVDLTHRPELARRLRILQTPTVFVLDRDAFVRTRFAGVPASHAVAAALQRVTGGPAHV
jgi:hypothetical protein